MQGLIEGMLLYHGSYAQIKEIDLAKCRPGLDFGKGFYLTSSLEQARKYIKNSVEKNIRNGNIPKNYPLAKGKVSVFKYHEEGLKKQYFPEANIDWLHYVVGNRNGSYFAKELQELEDCDIIGGKIANDLTTRTLIAYMQGILGPVGSSEADRRAIELLLPNKLKDQFCFKTVAAVACLEFIGSYSYAD